MSFATIALLILIVIISLKSGIMDMIIPNAWWAHGNPLMLFLPQPLKWFVARLLFLPTLSFRYFNYYLFGEQHHEQWWNRVDKTVILGALPFSWHVEKLIKEENLTGVINCCDEYMGPIQTYRNHNIEQLRIPIIDYLPPTKSDIRKAIAFIKKHSDHGGSVYVHCKAGRGRSAAVVICYLIQEYNMSVEDAETFLLEKRPVASKKLKQLKVVKGFTRRTVPSES